MVNMTTNHHSHCMQIYILQFSSNLLVSTRTFHMLSGFAIGKKKKKLNLKYKMKETKSSIASIRCTF